MKPVTPVCFMHIGKVGGHAITRELFGRFDPALIYNASSEMMDTVDPARLRNFDLIVGHWSHSHAAKLPHPRFLFSMMREPLDRSLSTYWFLRGYSGPEIETSAAMVAAAKRYDLADFLELDDPQVRRAIENHQTSFFAGDWRVKTGRSGEDQLRKALHNLDDFDLIGVYERYDASLQTLCAMLGWHSWPSQNRLNVTAGRGGVEELPNATLKRLKELNALDIELYAVVRARFERTHSGTLRKLVEVNHRAMRDARPFTVPSEVDVSFAGQVVGSGWHVQENIGHAMVRWLGPANCATVTVEVDRSVPLQVQLDAHEWTSRETLDSLTLSVDGRNSKLLSYDIVEREKGGPAASKRWLVPAASQPPPTPFLDLTFTVDRTVPINDANANATGRLGAVAVSLVRVSPLLPKAGAFPAAGGADNLVTLGIELLNAAAGRLSWIAAAYRIFVAATERDAADPNAWFWCAEGLCYQGRAAEAVNALETCLHLSKMGGSRPLAPALVPRLYERLGEALMMNDRLDAATPHLRHAIELQPPTEADRHRLNSASYILDGIERLGEPAAGRRMARWPVPLAEFKDLDEVIERSVIAGIERKPLLTPESRVVTFGSCFAKNIAHAFVRFGVGAECLGFGELINSTFANRALLEMVLEETSPSSEAGVRDVLRSYFGPSPEVIAAKIRQADMMVFTLGVAPAFFDRKTGLFHLSSPNANTLHLTRTKEFRTTTVEENLANLDYIVTAVRRLNASCQLVFTLSPVPLYATFEYGSAIIADCVSKSTLRVALDVIAKRHREIRYWPAFEVVRWVGAYNGPIYGAEDGTSRHVSEYAISAIIRAFVAVYGDARLRGRAEGLEQTEARRRNGEQAEV